jgi:signal transduction histidine kinase
VIAHGGKIELESAVGRGTTARMVLPLAAAGVPERFQVTEREK